MPSSPSHGSAAADSPLRGLGLLSLGLLVAQNTVLSYDHPTKITAQILLVYAAAARAKYDTTAVLFFAECIKLAASCLLGITQVKGSPTHFVQLMLEDARTTKHPLQMAVPAGLYLAQNNLLFVALARLSPVSFQITYQLKIPATAAFSSLLLGRRFSSPQIYAMIALMVGVIFVQLDLPKAVKTPTSGVTAPAAGAAASRRHLVGFVSVFVCALTSGYASVYFEQILKADAKPAQDGFVPLRTDDEAAMASEVPAPISSTSGPKLSTLVVTNVYLSLYSALALPVVGLVRDGRAIPQTTGFTSLVWAVVILQALGGLIIALVIRYSDNVTKTFALTLSVLICAFVQVVQFHLRPGLLFICGVVVVLASTYRCARSKEVVDLAPTPVRHSYGAASMRAAA